MNTSVSGSDTIYAVIREENNCPYCNNESSICAASLSRMVIDKSRRAGHCDNENYDSCPIFLARTLRRR